MLRIGPLLALSRPASWPASASRVSSVFRLDWVSAIDSMTDCSVRMCSVRLLRRSVSAARLWFTEARRSEEHTSELQSLMRISYAVFCLTKKKDYMNLTYMHTE